MKKGALWIGLCALLLGSSAWGHEKTPASPRPVKLEAADGTKIFGLRYGTGEATRPLVLLFHQAGSNKAEYATIGPRLVALGFDALAIDARSGGDMFDHPNETVAARGGTVGRDYAAALPDLEAALAWKKTAGYTGKTLAWGSSYSAALVFLLAQKHPGTIDALLAFSPGEYLRKTPGAVSKAAAQVEIPVLVLTPPKERGTAGPVFKAIASNDKAFELPEKSVHGSSMLITARNPAAKSIWPVVEAFLVRHR